MNWWSLAIRVVRYILKEQKGGWVRPVGWPVGGRSLGPTNHCLQERKRNFKTLSFSGGTVWLIAQTKSSLLVWVKKKKKNKKVPGKN